jgi:hypothetical protein
MPSLLLTLSSPTRHIDMVKRLKALAVKWTLYFGCNLLLDKKPVAESRVILAWRRNIALYLG